MNFDPNELKAVTRLDNTNAEQGVLSILINFPAAFDDVSDRLKPEHFSDDAHRITYAELCRQMAAGKGVDVITLAEQLQGTVTLQELHALSTSHDHSSRAIGKLVDIVIERFKSRQLHKLSGMLATLAFEASPVQDRIDRAQAELMKLDDVTDSDDWVDAHEGAIKHLDLIEAREAGTMKGIETGLHDFDEMLDGGMQPGNLVIIGARPSMGKAQPLSAKVLTSNGWSTMGALKIGDLLASVDGVNSSVTGVFPQGKKKVFRVTFTDGRATECCSEHLWRVNYRKWSEPKVLSTGEIRKLMTLSSMNGRLWIDSVSGDFGHSRALPVDPWLLGALLGDGDLTHKTIRFTKASDQILNLVRDAIPEPLELVHAGGYDWRISERGAFFGQKNSNPLTAAMRDLGLMDCKSDTKFIPEIYMTSDRDSRLNLLRGLLDTDGWVEKHGSVRFSSTSRKLAHGVQDLARSLGYWCSISEKESGYKKDGEYRSCLMSHILTISGGDSEDLFLFDGKRARCAGRTRRKHVAFLSIEESGELPCQCISVSHSSSLYITDEYVVTHNTALAVTLALHIARQHAVGFLSMEMPTFELMDRQTAILGRIPLSAIKRPERGLQYDRVVEAVELAKELKLYISDKSGLNILQVRSKARALKRRKGLKVLIVDYLGLMNGLDSKQNRAYQIEEITRGLKGLAKELGITVMALAQVNRGGAESATQVPGLVNLRDSGAIEQDADVVAFVHRPFMADPQIGDDFKHYGLLRIAKNRQGRCGDVHLHYEGEQTRFSSWSGPVPSKQAVTKGRGFE